MKDQKMAKKKKRKSHLDELKNSLLVWIKNPIERNLKRLHRAIDNTLIGESYSKQEDWVWETKQIIEDMAKNKREAWRKMCNFSREWFKEDYTKLLIGFAKERGVGEEKKGWVV